MPSDEEIIAAQERAAGALLQIPGVVMVAVGSKQVQGEPTGAPAIKVFVRRKRPLADIPPEERIPAEIDGFQTDVVESGDIHRLVDPPGVPAPSASDEGDTSRYRPLVGGCQISSEVSNGFGTLGAFLAHRTDNSRIFGLTNFHVVDGAVRPTAGTTKVGQEAAGDSCSGCCSSNVGVYSGGQQSDDRDEAVFQLDPGMKWMADILDIGAVRGEAAAITVVQAQAHSVKVRKRGQRTRLTGGVVTALNGTTGATANELVIQPNPNPAAGGATVYFAYEGDSGSVAVNDANEVVGLIYARTDSGLAVALPIRKVLERLNATEHLDLRVATAPAAGIVNTVPGSAMVEIPREVAPTLVGGPVKERVRIPAGAPWLPQTPALTPALMAGVAAELDQSPQGRRIVSSYLRHQGELLHLVNTNKRVATVWHRSGGSALVQYLVRMMGDPALRLPDSLHGRPLSECMDRLVEVFSRFGSDGLVSDLTDLRAVLANPSGLTYRQLMATMADVGGHA